MRIHLSWVILAAAGLLVTSPPARGQSCSIPAMGERPASMAIFDAIVQDFMCDNDIGAASVAISRNDVVIYRRAFGWEDEGQTKKLLPSAMMRLASVSKPFAAAAVRKLFAAEGLSLNSKAFDLDGSGVGILELEPFLEHPGDTVDPRLAALTVLQLIQHRTGWDNQLCNFPNGFCDPFGAGTQHEIEADMNLDGPPTPAEIGRYVLGKPLPANPGGFRYANVNYLFLGLIVEQVIADEALPYQDYVDYVHQQILGSLCVPPSEVEMGTADESNPREPWHDGSSIYNLPAYFSAGGLIATAHSIATFADDYFLFGDSAGIPGNGTDAHFGSLPGAATVARKLFVNGKSIGYAVLFNKREGVDVYQSQIMALLDQQVLNFQGWPISPVPAADCDGDGLDDLCEIETTSTQDIDLDGYLDACEHCNNDVECGDGLPCTGDRCYVLSCENPQICAPGLNCHPYTAQCEDFCSFGSGGGPGSGTWGICNDGNPCTLDRCLTDMSWPGGTPGVCRSVYTCN